MSELKHNTIQYQVERDIIAKSPRVQESELYHWCRVYYCKAPFPVLVLALSSMSYFLLGRAELIDFDWLIDVSDLELPDLA